MNIFVLHSNPEQAALYHTDKHVRKMILETTQMLSTAHHLLDGYKPNIYKPAYANHPCTKWVRQTSANYVWTVQLLYGLHNEYYRRFEKYHASLNVLDALTKFPNNIVMGGLTPFAQAMPIQYQQDNAINAYRMYYNYEKRHLFQWTKTNQPQWILNELSCDYYNHLYYLKNYTKMEGGK
jgi:hypothetical protein